MILGIVALGSVLPSQAAGPGLAVTTAGEPYRWDNTRPIVYNLDPGDLGAIGHDAAARMVQSAFEQWQGVITARLEFEEAEALDRDVTGSNLNAFFGAVPSDVNPIILDQDGSVTEAFYGPGAAPSFFAFGGALRTTATGRITQGFVVLNG